MYQEEVSRIAGGWHPRKLSGSTANMPTDHAYEETPEHDLIHAGVR